MMGDHDPNVTLRDTEDGKKFWFCPVCREIREVEITKHGKPYLTCNDCGVQLFVLGKRGIKRFKELYDNKISIESFILLKNVDLINALKEKLIEIQNKKPLFGKDKDLCIQETILAEKLNHLKDKYIY